MADPGPDVSTFSSGEVPLTIDFAARSVYVDESEVSLTPTEFDVLACLARRAGSVVSTPEIIESVWGEWFGPTDHVFVHVHHIRRKLGPCGKLIVTKRKAGYLLRVEPPSSEGSVGGRRMSQAYLDLLQEDARARGVIWVIMDQHRRVTWVSDSIAALLGWSPTDVIGQHPWTLAHGDDLDAFMQHFPLSGGDSLVAFDTRLCGPDGRVVPIGVAAQVLRGVDGQRLGGIGEWKPEGGSEGALSGSAVPFRLHYDGEHLLTAVEPHQPFLGWDPDDVIGTPFSLAGVNPATTQRMVDGLAAQGEVHHLERTPAFTAEGEHVLVDITLRLRMADGQVTGYTGVVRALD